MNDLIMNTSVMKSTSEMDQKNKDLVPIHLVITIISVFITTITLYAFLMFYTVPILFEDLVYPTLGVFEVILGLYSWNRVLRIPLRVDVWNVARALHRPHVDAGYEFFVRFPPIVRCVRRFVVLLYDPYWPEFFTEESLSTVV